MPYKTAQLLGGGHAHRQSLGAHGSVELGERGTLVGGQEKEPDAEGEDTQQVPADERQFQYEIVKLFTVHHLFAQLHGAGGGQVRILSQQVGDQCVAVGPVNSRNEKQKHSCKDFQPGQKGNLHDVQVGRLEDTENGAERGGALAAFHKVAAAADHNGRCNKDRPQYGQRQPDEGCYNQERQDIGGQIFPKRDNIICRVGNGQIGTASAA